MSIKGSGLPRIKHRENRVDLRLFRKYLVDSNAVFEVVEAEEGQWVKKWEFLV